MGAGTDKKSVQAAKVNGKASKSKAATQKPPAEEGGGEGRGLNEVAKRKGNLRAAETGEAR